MTVALNFTKPMKKIFATLFLYLFSAVSFVSAQDVICFENKGLKDQHRISYRLEGNKIVEGYYEVMGYDETTSAETFEFSGTKSGNLLQIKFVGTIPYERPPRTKSIVWTLGKGFVKVPRYGKNYETNKFAAYTATYEKCTEN